MIDIDRIKDSVDWTMEPGDPMYSGNADHYRSVGRSALQAIVAAGLLANVGEPRSILDFACANGRVTRWLRAAYPLADLHVADIDSRWAEWSGRQFQATAWLSEHDLAATSAPRKYDIIWCGSLATHISPSQTVALLHKFHEWLEPQGVAVVTTHGRRFVHNAVAGTHDYFPVEKSIEPLLADMAATGFGYVPHPGQDHGISAATPEWLTRTVIGMDARIITVSEHAWDGHQDVLAFQRQR